MCSHCRDALRPSPCKISRPMEGVGNAGCPMHPQPLCIGSKHRVVTTVAPEITRHSRTRMVLTAYVALFPATNSSCHRHRRMMGCLSPVGPTRLRRFSTSNGCQDHTVLPYASAPFVWCALDRSRKPPCDLV